MRQPKCSKAYICRGAKSSPFQIEGSYKMKIAHRAAAAGGAMISLPRNLVRMSGFTPSRYGPETKRQISNTWQEGLGLRRALNSGA